MASELQRIVDSLGMRLQRAVALDDPRLRLLVYSPHYGIVDDTRLASILHREAPERAAKWALGQGVARAQGPVRLPPNPDLELLARVCVPVRCQGVLLGYLWLIDAESSLSDADLADAVAAADEAGLVMYREQLLRELERGRERELLRDLLSDDATLRDHAARALVDASLFVQGPKVAALVVAPVHEAGNAVDEPVRIAIDLALDQIRRGIAARQSLQLARPDHGVFLVGMGDPGVRSGGLGRLAERLRETAARPLAAVEGWRVVVGVGDVADHLADAQGSYRQARLAVRIAEIVPLFGSIAAWSDLGVYRTLAQLPPEELTSQALHPGLVTLLQTEGAETLVRTLECYLDRAGDAKATAEELVVHRTSLYYRLGRIEKLAGVDLHRGDDRLALHLGLKMARLAGLHPTPSHS